MQDLPREAAGGGEGSGPARARTLAPASGKLVAQAPTRLWGARGEEGARGAVHVRHVRRASVGTYGAYLLTASSSLEWFAEARGPQPPEPERIESNARTAMRPPNGEIRNRVCTRLHPRNGIAGGLDRQDDPRRHIRPGLWERSCALRTPRHLPY